MRVLVPFRGKKIYTAIVLNLHQEPPENFAPKEIISVLDEVPILPDSQLRFWQWLSDYYLTNLGEVYRFAFPSSLKLESETYIKLKPHAVIDYENLDAQEFHLIQALEVRQMINLTEMESFIPKKEIVRTINSLIDLQYIEIDEKIQEKYRAREVAYVRIAAEALMRNSLAQILLQLKRSPKQQELFLLLLEKQTENPEANIRKSAVFEEGSFSHAQLRALVDKNLVEEYYLQQDRLAVFGGETEELEKLSLAQQEADNAIRKAFEEGKDVLLHGVTSSGKTHVYLERIAEAVAGGGNVLFLLPEISLTKQIVSRLEKKYGNLLGFYHQKLTDFERVEVWRRVRNGEVKIIIATRNGLFLPFRQLSLIIVDEEHDSAYRPQEVSPYFNAKDAALMLANFYGGRVILGSATPSVESFYFAKKDRLRYVPLMERFGGVALPEFELIDFREEQNAKLAQGNFTPIVISEIEKQLSEKKQIMILHNRRGYASVVECESCGHVTYCSNCDVVMTYHKFSNELKCHYCGHRAAKPTHCAKCNSINLNSRGIGVEQIHEEVSRLFPDANADRMDVDAMRRKFAYEKLYEKIENGETDIIVGTQMISKGLDFDHIEMVAIPRADSMLYVQDFRAEERAFQLITQISGRAGRTSGAGKIFIQTYNPEHKVFQLLAEKNHNEIYSYFLSERQKFNYPPFVKLLQIQLKHRKEDKVDRASRFLASVLQKYLPAECIFGPAKAPVGKINLLYHYQILLKLPRGRNYVAYKKLVLKSLEEFEEVSAYGSIKKQIIVDF